MKHRLMQVHLNQTWTKFDLTMTWKTQRALICRLRQVLCGGAAERDRDV